MRKTQNKKQNGKTLKSLTLPQSVAKQLEQTATQKGCKQADLVKVALCELINQDGAALDATLIKYKII